MNSQLTPQGILLLIFAYFAMLLVAAWYTTRRTDNQAFFIGGHSSPWYLVAFGMIGTSISGVTFISVPGAVGGHSMGAFSYLQLVMGNVVGYWVVALVLMPLYYRLRLISIYSYLERRFGFWSYKTGAFYFLLSRSIGSSFRLFLMAAVLQLFVFDQLFTSFHISFPITVLFTLGLIWIYTYRGGVRTIVYTDTLQTVFLVVSLVLSIYFIGKELNLGAHQLFDTVRNSPYSQVFFWDYKLDNYFFKQFVSGFLIAIAMVGLDQDLMQKNISCRNIREAQINMFSFSAIIMVVNILFVSLGALLYIYASSKNIPLPAKPDHLFPMLAIQHFAPIVGVLFLLGIIAASYASSDSALTALTTSFCIDILNFEKLKDVPQEKLTQWRHYVHLGFTALFFVLIVWFNSFKDQSVVVLIFKVAGFTYGPLLGLYAFGLATRLSLRDKLVPVACLVSPIICFFIDKYSADLFAGFKFGNTIILVNGILTFLLLLAISKPATEGANANTVTL